MQYKGYSLGRRLHEGCASKNFIYNIGSGAFISLLPLWAIPHFPLFNSTEGMITFILDMLTVTCETVWISEHGLGDSRI